MKKRVILCVSSCTGNTRKIAEGLEKELKRENYDVSILNNKESKNIHNLSCDKDMENKAGDINTYIKTRDNYMHNKACNNDVNNYGDDNDIYIKDCYNLIYNEKCENIQNEDVLFIICFWCRRSTLDFESIKTVDLLKGKDILAFGTMGSYPDSSYGDRVRNNVHEHINRENNCLGVYLSQGKVSLKSTERRRNLPKNNPHYLNDEGLKRHMDSQSHPDEDDIKNAVLFLRENLRDKL